MVGTWIGFHLTNNSKTAHVNARSAKIEEVKESKFRSCLQRQFSTKGRTCIMREYISQDAVTDRTSHSQVIVTYHFNIIPFLVHLSDLINLCFISFDLLFTYSLQLMFQPHLKKKKKNFPNHLLVVTGNQH